MMDFIHSAFEISKNKSVVLEVNRIVEALKDEKLTWVHLDAYSPETKTWLETELGFLDPFIISALLAEETRPRVSKMGDGILLILRGINFNSGQDDDDMVALRLYADKDRIISLEKRPVRSVHEFAIALETAPGASTAGEVVSDFVHRMSKKADQAVAELDDNMDTTEQMMVDEAASLLDNIRRDLSEIRMKAIKIRRHLAPQRDALFELKSVVVTWLSDNDRRSIHESYNRTVRAVEELDAIRERSQIIKDEITSRLSEKLNKNTYVLSLIAAIFLPLGFLTGLFGINIGGLPGINNGNAFLIFCLFMTFLVIIQIIVFRKLKWF